RLLDSTTGQEVKRLALGGPGMEAEIVTLSPDGKRLAAASRFGGRGVQGFDVNSGSGGQALASPNREVGQLRFSADGRVLVGGGGVTGRDGSAVAWDVNTGKELGRFSLTGENYRAGFAVSPDGSLLAGWGQKTGIVLWDVGTGKEAQRISLGENNAIPCTTAVFSPDGKHLAAAEFAAVSVWETATGQLVYRSAARGSNQPVLAYSPDGKTLAAADSGAVQLRDAASGKRLGMYSGLQGQPLSLVFAEDKLLALGLSGQALWVRDVKGNQSLSPPGGHQFPVLSIVFTPDGQRLLTSALDGVLVWDVPKGQEVGRIEVKESEADRLRG